jgi:eukaryotic-like serine/threonine-protein kinase
MRGKMSLPAGTRLGPYEIVAPLGSGGMGEVYRARDPRLSREVAIKVLPAAYSRTPERLRRFEQEARAAGALNHPNILAVYDTGAYSDAPYLVTELLEGTTLREQLRSGALPPRKAVGVAIQIAQGLAAAHEKGIVHRDLKPENIFLCRDGRVKILDFGLAKLVARDTDQTMTDLEQTEPGVVMGTPAYMSPEQVRGQNADQRSDIFSFGAVLHEMLSGTRPFTGSSAADIASAVLNHDPPQVTGGISAGLDGIVRHCLEKSPEQRFQSARDLAFQLESLSSISESSRAVSPGRKLSAKVFWGGMALLAVGAAVLSGWWWHRREPIKSQFVRFQRLTDFAGLEGSPALSPDGKSLAFVSDSSGSRQIWIRLLAGGPPLQITKDAGDHLEPRWSQDSAALIYYTPPSEGAEEGTIWEIPALGGPPRRLAASVSGTDTSHDGKRIAFFRLNNRQVELVTADRDGSDERVVSRFGPGFGYRYPRWSPDDKAIAYVHSLENWNDDVYSVAASGGDAHLVTQDHMLNAGLAWLPDGSGIVYSSARGSTLLYLPTMHLWLAPAAGGEPRQLTFGDSGDESPDIDPNWRVVTSRKHMEFDIWKIPVGGDPGENVGRAVRVTHQTGQVQTPSLGPEDREVAYLSDSGGHGNIWVLRLDNGQSRQITFEKSESNTLGVPVWSPDGNYITFAATKFRGDQARTVEYWLIRPDGSGLQRVIKEGAWTTWSGDSRWLYYSESSPARSTGSFRLMKVAVEGGEPVVVRTDNARGPAVAPDGSALFYVVPLQNLNGSLDYELRVARPPEGESKLLARISGERVPNWQGLHPVISRDGKWLATPLDGNLGTNLWVASTLDGKLRQVTDFGQKRTFIARRVSWSSDSKWLFAAVGEGDADIVMMEGLLR